VTVRSTPTVFKFFPPRICIRSDSLALQVSPNSGCRSLLIGYMLAAILSVSAGFVATDASSLLKLKSVAAVPVMSRAPRLVSLVFAAGFLVRGRRSPRVALPASE
jgi:hypothetical protein